MSSKGAGRYGTYFGNITFSKHPYFTQTGKDREDDPDQYIANMRNGAIAGFKYFMVENIKEIAVQVKGNASGIMEISTALHGKKVCEIKINATKNYEYFKGKAFMDSGEHALYFKYKGTGRIDFKSFIFA